MQFFQTAVDIQDELIEFCMNENNIPKKYRFVHTMLIIEHGQQLVNDVVDANTIYVKTNEDAIDRRRYQQKASGECEKILQKLQNLRRVRERRKLKELKAKMNEGKITFDEVRQQYASWQGYMKHKMSWRTVQNMNRLFNELFIDQWQGKEDKNYEDKIRRNSNDLRRISQENRTEFVDCADRRKSS